MAHNASAEGSLRDADRALGAPGLSSQRARTDAFPTLGIRSSSLKGETEQPPASHHPERSNSVAPQAPQEAMDLDREERITLLPPNEQGLPSSIGSGDSSEVPPRNEPKTTESTPQVQLHKSAYISFLVFVYAGLALTAWVLICLLTFKPITTSQYGFRYGSDSYGLHAKYVRSEEIYRAARTVQSVVSVLTIPLTSAVCSGAAVVYAQSSGKSAPLTMRQLVTLADRGWSDPTTFVRIMRGQWKNVGSSLLFSAIVLNVIGASITPLQTYFLSQKTIKTPNDAALFEAPIVAEISERFPNPYFSPIGATDRITISTRNALKSAYSHAPQPRLWQGNVNCSGSYSDQHARCVSETATLGNFSALSTPFLAQLSVGYHTGLIRQFIPRFDFSVEWETLLPEDMPANCADIEDAFYVKYANSSLGAYVAGPATPRNWSVEACMPGNTSGSPWQDTRSRQSFTEELYLNVSIMGFRWSDLGSYEDDRDASSGIFKATSRTTTGYFELPNYMNEGKPGPIIEGDPDGADNCGSDCYEQSFRKLEPRNTPPATNLLSNGSYDLKSGPGNGPLLTVALALFGFDSYFQARLDRPEEFIRTPESWPEQMNQGEYVSPCVDPKPLSLLLREKDYDLDYPCGTDRFPQNSGDLEEEIVDYLASMVGTDQSQNAFASAVFLALESWLTVDGDDSFMDRRRVHSDPGADTIIPVISVAGMVIVSLLWTVYIGWLLALALYSARAPRWTNQLDAFAMMRLGAAMHEHIPLDVGFEVKTIRALDKMPGHVGDATGGEGEMGILGLGAVTPLNATRHYRSYEGDQDEQIRQRHLGSSQLRYDDDGKMYLLPPSQWMGKRRP